MSPGKAIKEQRTTVHGLSLRLNNIKTTNYYWLCSYNIHCTVHLSLTDCVHVSKTGAILEAAISQRSSTVDL